MADLHGFDAQTVEPNDSFDPIPNGDYLCIITASEMKPTKAGDGAYLELELEVLDGPYKGRKLWDRLNLNNSNDTTVKIAKGTLSAICRAVGVLQPKDSCDLYDLPMLVKIACKKRDDTDELTNSVKGYKRREGAASSPVMAAAPVAGTAKPASPPWKRT